MSSYVTPSAAAQFEEAADSSAAAVRVEFSVAKIALGVFLGLAMFSLFGGILYGVGAALFR